MAALVSSPRICAGPARDHLPGPREILKVQGLGLVGFIVPSKGSGRAPLKGSMIRFGLQGLGFVGLMVYKFRV